MFKNTSLIALFLTVLVFVTGVNAQGPIDGLDHKVFIPITMNSQAPNDILRVSYEVLADSSRVNDMRYNITVYWQNQGWEKYYLWLRETGDNEWCYVSMGVATKHRRSVAFNPFMLHTSGPSGNCDGHPAISLSKDYELILADNVMGQESAKSELRTVSFENEQIIGTGSFFYPELQAEVEMAPIEESGVVTIRWFGLAHFMHAADVKFINDSGQCYPLYSTNPNDNTYESGRSLTVTNLTVGEAYTFYVAERDTGYDGDSDCDPSLPYVDVVNFTLK